MTIIMKQNANRKIKSLCIPKNTIVNSVDLDKEKINYTIENMQTSTLKSPRVSCGHPYKDILL
jgi:hypothetical protein